VPSVAAPDTLPGLAPEPRIEAEGARIAYQSDLVTLWHGDCAEVIAGMPRDSVDLIATDPPYGVKWQSHRRNDRFARIAGDDGSLDVPGILGLATDALPNSRHVYVFGYLPEDLAGSMWLASTAQLIWDKDRPGSGDLSATWGPSWEPITFGVHVKSKTNLSNGYGNLTARLRRGSVIRVKPARGKAVTRHPTEKPVELMRQLIESSSLPGDVVFDPFAGSGSTLVAAVLAGRRALGVELDPGYVATAIDRIRRAEALAAEMARI
jgi:DNA modification methylase